MTKSVFSLGSKSCNHSHNDSSLLFLYSSLCSDGKDMDKLDDM